MAKLKKNPDAYLHAVIRVLPNNPKILAGLGPSVDRLQPTLKKVTSIFSQKFSKIVFERIGTKRKHKKILCKKWVLVVQRKRTN